MSAIGDYIHLTKTGYQNPQPKHQGTIPFGYQNNMIKESDSIDAFGRQRKKMQNLINRRGSEEIAKKIQKQIRELQGVEGDSIKARLFYGYLLNAIEEDLDVVLRDNLQAVSKQKNSLEENLTIIKRALNNIKAVDSKASKGGVKLEQTLIPFAKGVKNLMKDLTNGTLNLKNINDLTEQRKQIYEYVTSFCDYLGKTNNKGQKILQIKTIQNDQKQEGEKVVVSRFGGEPISIFSFALIVDDLVKKLNYATAEKQGLAAEIVVAASSAAAQRMAKQTINKTFIEQIKNQGVVGNKKGQIYFDVNDYAESIYSELKKGYSFDEKSGIMISDMASSDKVDVKFYLNEDEANPLNLSIKNYLKETVKKYGFGGVSGAPFLNLAKQMGNNDFVNHWINATIWHGEDFENNLNNEIRGKYWETAHALMKYSLVTFGMIKSGTKIYGGQIGESDTADYLVWNNASGAKNQGMVVYPLSTLLENIYTQIKINADNKKWIEGYDNKFLNPIEWSTVKMLTTARQSQKKTVPQIRKRISLALVKMFQAKISTHLFLSDELLSRMKT